MSATVYLASSVVTANAIAKNSDVPAPAVWQRHALIVDLQSLPRRYTCDELWYKFRDVLLAVGASSRMKIMPYECGAQAGEHAYSPKVELDFKTPSTLSGDQKRW